MNKVQEQKAALVAATKYYVEGASVKTAHPDLRWEKGGTERFAFEHPEHRRVLGLIEIDSSVEEINQVRMELVVPPYVAENVIMMLMAVAAEEIEEYKTAAPVAEVITIPPTRDPTAADLEEMEEEEREVDLPPPVDHVIHLENL